VEGRTNTATASASKRKKTKKGKETTHLSLGEKEWVGGGGGGGGSIVMGVVWTPYWGEGGESILHEKERRKLTLLSRQRRNKN